MSIAAAPSDATALLALIARVMDPVRIVPTENPAVSKQILGAQGTLHGFSFEDVGGVTGANQEKSATTAVGAAINVVLTDTAGEQTFVTGFDIDLGIGAAAATVTATLTGLTNPLSYDVSCNVAGGSTLSVRFPQPLPGAVITLSLPAIGGAAAANSITIYGTDSAAAGGMVELYDGPNANATLLCAIQVPIGGATLFGSSPNALPFDSGLFMRIVSGTVRGSLWIRPALFIP